MSTGTNLNNDYFSLDTLIASGTGGLLYLGTTNTLSSSEGSITPTILTKALQSTGYSYHYKEPNYLDGIKNNLYGSESTIPSFNFTDDHLYYSTLNSNFTSEHTTGNSLGILISGSMGLNIDNDGSVSINSIQPYFPKSPRSIKRENIKKNLATHFKSRANSVNPLKGLPENEQRAIETLREEITESEFRKYIKYGFVLVKGQSGKTYQIYRNESHTKVWKNGKVIEEICVRIKNYKIPPTDNVIAFSNMIQIDEEEFRKIGNVYKRMSVA